MNLTGITQLRPYQFYFQKQLYNDTFDNLNKRKQLKDLDITREISFDHEWPNCIVYLILLVILTDFSGLCGSF